MTEEQFQKNWLPFYGSKYPEMFAIERRCMDREGKVVEFLNQNLPEEGLVLDVGAGDGFTAEKLMSPQRTVIPLEPDGQLIDRNKKMPWINAVAQDLPFHNNSLDAAYATWAFFFPDYHPEECLRGLKELYRVLKPNSKIFVVNNAGHDEFTSFTDNNIGDWKTESKWWAKDGFEMELIDTHFRF